MTQAAPRRKVNGDAAIRPMRSGIKCSCRPLLLSASKSSGSGRLAADFVSAWLSRGVRARSPLPMFRRVSQGLFGFRKSNLSALSPGVRIPSTLYSRLVEAVAAVVRTTLDEGAFSGIDFDETDLARGLIGRPFYLRLAMGNTAPRGIGKLIGEAHLILTHHYRCEQRKSCEEKAEMIERNCRLAERFALEGTMRIVGPDNMAGFVGQPSLSRAMQGC